MTNAPTLLDSRLIEAGQRNFEAATAAQKNAAERLGKIYEESLRFATARFDENRKVFQEMVGVRSLPDALPILTGHFERTAKAYTEEMEVIATLVSEQTTALVEETVAQTQAAVKATAPVVEAVVEDTVEATKASAVEATESATETAKAAVEENTNA